jgi:hypothetical protein
MRRIALSLALLAALTARSFAADSFIQVPPDDTGKKIDTSELTVGANVVERQRYVVCDNLSAGNCAAVNGSGQLAVAVGNFPATQPISGSISVSNFPATQPISGSVSVSNFPASQNVVCTSGCASGGGGATFGAAFPTTGQAIGLSQGGNLVALTGTGGNLNVNLAGNSFGTLTIGGSVSVSNFPATQPISGSISVSNLPATQPVSGSVSVCNFPATQPVTGAFFQATQPVSAASLPLPSGAATSALQTTGNASLANLDVALSTRLKPSDTLTAVATVGTITNPVAVTGTFFQATQPVSGTLTANAGTGTFTVGQATGTNLHMVCDSGCGGGGAITANQGTANTIGNAWPVKVTDGTNAAAVKAASTAPVATDPSIVIAMSPNGNDVQPVDASGNSLVSAKGTQPTNFIGVQRSIDAGRTYVNLYYDRIAGVTTEALATMTKNVGGSTTTGTSYTVTAGKTLRCVEGDAEILNTTTTANRTITRWRSAATVTATSPIVAMASAMSPVATASNGWFSSVPLSSAGFEIAGGQQIGVSHLENITTSGIASAFMHCFEY